MAVTMEMMFHTWNDIVKMFNYEQSLIDQEPLQGGRGDGSFSYRWVQDLCKKLFFDTCATGSEEPRDIDLADV